MVLDTPQRSLEAAEAAFCREHPSYRTTARLDELRATDYARLDAGRHVYLDYTGGGLYASSQLSEHFAPLQAGVFGNPHSTNPTSAESTALVERARDSVLEFFRASPDEYAAIFTPNATGGLRLVGEAYPFHAGDRFLLTFDNHNSVNGIREFARARGAETTYIPSVAPDLRVDPDLLPRYLTETIGEHHNLFAYPAQSNFSGVQHPLEWIEQAHAQGWDVMLDAAAFVPTNRLDLSVWHPDFVPISFYKCSAGQPVSVACSPVVRRSPSWSDRGSRAARSSPHSYSVSITSPRRAPLRMSRPAGGSVAKQLLPGCVTAACPGLLRQTPGLLRRVRGRQRMPGPRRRATIGRSSLHQHGSALNERRT
jgi:hypothetical protein